MFAWWIVGQVWVFGSENCRATAPPLWNYSLILIILMYIWILAPLILIALLCVCMPCVLVIMRIFAEPKGATKEVIESLPTIKFGAYSVQLSLSLESIRLLFKRTNVVSFILFSYLAPLLCTAQTRRRPRPRLVKTSRSMRAACAWKTTRRAKH